MTRSTSDRNKLVIRLSFANRSTSQYLSYWLVESRFSPTAFEKAIPGLQRATVELWCLPELPESATAWTRRGLGRPAVRSSRRLEAETHRNLEVIWLLRCQRPDFKTIADFRRENREAFRQGFRDFVKVCRIARNQRAGSDRQRPA